jgi:hypothetical protein
LIYDTFAAMTTVATSLYPFYAFPFQVLFPLLLLLVALFRRQKKKAGRPAPKTVRKEQ